MVKTRLISLALICLLLGPDFVSAQTAPASNPDIFFLDLGIVIEPKTGKEVYNRLVNPNSEEVKLRVKKVESGSVYMATSKEMLDALQRIQQRMDVLEKSFQSQVTALRTENKELRNMLESQEQKAIPVTTTKSTPVMLPKAEPKSEDIAEAKPVSSQKEVRQKSQPKQKSQLKSTPATQINKVKKPTLNYSEYMAAIFAYQREDYRDALKHFEKLDLTAATPEMAANILYWSADAHGQLGEPYQALSELDGLLSKYIQSDRVDDALIQKGLLYRKTGQDELALAAFTRLVQEFPSSEYARLANMELKKADIIP